VVDPVLEVSPATGQVDDLVERLGKVVEKGERALVTTLTKRSSEDLAEYLSELGFAVRYIHSELDAFERVELLRELRRGDISVLVGVNLLREGLDLPEVSLVAIIDADREGFLRSHRSLVQMTGRAARNAAGTVVLYADRKTDSIRRAMEETARRREIQINFNRQHGINPSTVKKDIVHILPEDLQSSVLKGEKTGSMSLELPRQELERMMWEAVERLDFEKAASIRDILQENTGGEKTHAEVDRGKRRKGTQFKKHRRTDS
jgi:excinuclease ABC subunit B